MSKLCLNLPLAKPIKYFSPTSYNEAENCELSFYLHRHSDAGIPRGEQTEAMAIGSAFDSFVKAEIAYSQGMEENKNLLAELLKNVAPEHANVIKAGNMLFQKYKAYGALDSLIDEGILNVEMDITAGKKEEIIWYGKPDAQLRGGLPLDWKVSGYFSAYGVYPKPGYSEVFTKDGRSGRHAKVLPFEQIDRKWAIQLLVYNWLFDEKPPYRGAIDMLACKGDDLRIAKYRSEISQSFADEIWSESRDKWDRFQKGLFEKPVAQRSKCEPYNNPLPCTLACPFYKQMHSDPMIAEMMRKK